MSKMLGILIISARHGAHLKTIAPTARRKGILLQVHISGAGVKLCLQKRFQAVLALAQVTICHMSAQRLGIADQIKTQCPGMLTSDQRPPLPFNRCPKRIVL